MRWLWFTPTRSTTLCRFSSSRLWCTYISRCRSISQISRTRWTWCLFWWLCITNWSRSLLFIRSWTRCFYYFGWFWSRSSWFFAWLWITPSITTTIIIFSWFRSWTWLIIHTSIHHYTFNRTFFTITNCRWSILTTTFNKIIFTSFIK